MRLYVSCLLFALVTALLIPISASAQTDAECAAIYDSVGTRVARASLHPASGLLAIKSSIIAYALFEHDGRLATLIATKDGLFGGGTAYMGSNCTPPVYMSRSDSLQPQAYLAGNVVWYPDTAATPAGITTSYWRSPGSGSCTGGTTFLSDAVPAYTFTLPDFTPPFHLEPEPCFTPPDPEPEPVINACMKNKSGTLRIVADPADCTSRETPITLLGQ